MSSAISEASKNKWIYLTKTTSANAVALPTKWEELCLCRVDEHGYVDSGQIVPYDLVANRGITTIRIYYKNLLSDAAISTTQISGIPDLHIYYR